jgi:hypothetical protein
MDTCPSVGENKIENHFSDNPGKRPGEARAGILKNFCYLYNLTQTYSKEDFEYHLHIKL